MRGLRVAALLGAGVFFLTGTAAAETEKEAGQKGMPCRECAAKGWKECPGCQGKKKVLVACVVCQGAKGTPCASCEQGLVLCRECGGTGSKTASSMTFGFRRRGEPVPRVPCPPQRGCPKCTRGLIHCKLCKRTGSTPVPCYTCDEKGRVECASCAGKGKLFPEPEAEARIVEPPAETPSVNRTPHLKARAAARVQSIEKSLARLDGLKTRGEASLDLFRRLEDFWKHLQGLAAAEAGLASSTKGLEASWRLCARDAAACRQLLEHALALSPRAAEHLEGLRAFIQRMDQPAPHEPADEETLEMHSLYSGELRTTVERLDLEVKDLSSALQDRERRIKSLKARHQTQLDKRAREEKEKREVQQAHERFLAVLPGAGQRAQMPPVEGRLLPTSKPGAIHVQVNYFDTELLVEEAAEAVPNEGALRVLPPFITEVFKSCPELMKVHVVIAATGVSDTGLEELRAVQKFTMDRGRWGELNAGRYKGLWQEMLSRSKPAPAYPRPRVIGWWPFLALSGVLVLALGIIYVARATMFSR